MFKSLATLLCYKKIVMVISHLTPSSYTFIQQSSMIFIQFSYKKLLNQLVKLEYLLIESKVVVSYTCPIFDLMKTADTLQSRQRRE